MNFSSSPTSEFDPRAEALAVHTATFARINNWPAGAETVFRFGDKSRVETVPVSDGNAFADVVARNHGRPEEFATVNPRLAGAVAAGGFQTGNADQTAATQMLMADLDVGKEGNPATIAEAISMAETFALTPHAMYTRGKGIQAIFLLEAPLVSTEDKLLVGAHCGVPSHQHEGTASAVLSKRGSSIKFLYNY